MLQKKLNDVLPSFGASGGRFARGLGLFLARFDELLQELDEITHLEKLGLLQENPQLGKIVRRRRALEEKLFGPHVVQDRAKCFWGSVDEKPAYLIGYLSLFVCLSIAQETIELMLNFYFEKISHKG